MIALGINDAFQAVQRGQGVDWNEQVTASYEHLEERFGSKAPPPGYINKKIRDSLKKSKTKPEDNIEVIDL